MSIFAHFDETFMRMAIREAQKAAEDEEVPLGCVIVAPAVLEPAHDGHPAVFDPDPTAARILGRGHNQTEMLSDATAHAEMLAMSAAFQARGDWRLGGARLYVTKEPCPMCAGGIVLARLDTIVWGVSDPKRGGGSVFGIFDHPGINHHPAIITGVLEAECKSILQDFFQRRRCASGQTEDGLATRAGGRTAVVEHKGQTEDGLATRVGGRTADGQMTVTPDGNVARPSPVWQ